MKYRLPILIIPILSLLLSTCAKLNPFQTPPDHPVIDSLKPSSGGIGTQLRLYGSGFSTSSSLDTVRINGVGLRVDSPSTSTVLLVTVIDSTGTGPVKVNVSGSSGIGPVFTYNSASDLPEPVITGIGTGWNDGSGFAIKLQKLPPSDNGIHVLVGGVEIPIFAIARQGSPYYHPGEGEQILIDADTAVLAHATGMYANFMVAFNSVKSAPFPFQLTPILGNLVSNHGESGFAGRDTITITGNFFGDRTLPSGLDMPYNGQQLSPAPTFLSWTNTKIVAIMPAYPNLPVNGTLSISVKVGEKISRPTYYYYYGTISATVSLIAGSEQGNADGSGASARFNSPAGLAINAQGTLYVADQGNHSIRKITRITSLGGYVSTVAGSIAGFKDGSTAEALFNMPADVETDANGTVYVADFANNRIRTISSDGLTVSTLAGDGSPSTFWYPSGLTGTAGALYIADLNNHRIRRITRSIVTFAGSVAGYAEGAGTAAKFNNPKGVAIGPDGTIYVADQQNHAIRAINVDGMVSTLAGGSSGRKDGTGSTAQFELPAALAVDGHGNIYVADFYYGYLRKITPEGVTTTIVPVFADGSGIAAFSAPSGIALDQQGNIYVSDAGTHRIYKMVLK